MSKARFEICQTASALMGSDSIAAPVPPDVDGVTNHGYDNRDQLTSAVHSDVDNPDELYGYDANGNRLQSHRHGTAYLTDPNTANRLRSDGTFNYEYDDEGNMKKRTEIATGKVREFQWEHRNRLVAVIDKDANGSATQDVRFTYDPFNRRIGKAVDTSPPDTVAAVFTHFVYDRDNILLDFADNDGAAGPNPPVISRRYLYGSAVDQVLAQEDSAGNALWHLADHLGSVRDLVDNNGVVQNNFLYDSFGNIIGQTNPDFRTRFLFTGRELDAETGLYYYRSRYYDAAIGRFLSEDPIVFLNGDANHFRYVGNGPVANTDAYGLQLAPVISNPRPGLDPGVDIERKIFEQEIQRQRESRSSGAGPTTSVTSTCPTTSTTTPADSDSETDPDPRPQYPKWRLFGNPGFWAHFRLEREFYEKLREWKKRHPSPQ